MEGNKININILIQLVNLDVMGRVITKVTSAENKKGHEFASLLSKAIKTVEQPNTNCRLNKETSSQEQAEKIFSSPEKKGRINIEDVSLPSNELTNKLSPDKKYDHLIAASAVKYGIEPALLKALIKTESNFNEAARSRSGAQGLTQIMPDTARYLGVNPLNPNEAIEGGAKYLGQMLNRYRGNVEVALAAYNAGPGSVDRYGGIPPYRETHFFIEKVKQHLISYKSDFIK